MSRTYLRGDMYCVDLGRGVGSEQEGYRPVVIIQNNISDEMFKAAQQKKLQRAKCPDKIFAMQELF